MREIPAKQQQQQPAPENNYHSTVASVLFNPIMTTLLAYVLDRPLFELYMFGPALWGYGFHEGKSQSLICAEYTGIAQIHWLDNTQECETLIMRKFNALLVTIHFAIYICVLLAVAWSACGCAAWWCCCRRRSRSRQAANNSGEPGPVCYRCAFRRVKSLTDVGG